MKRILKLLTATVPAMLLGAAIHGQTKAWTLQDCIEYAIDNNITLQQSRNSFLSGLEDTYQAKAARNRHHEYNVRQRHGEDKGRDILSQFLIEATLLSVAGGVIGVLLGIVAAYVVKAILNYPISISTGSIVLSFAVCTIIGIFFGWYPARKASNLDPIEALRYE